MNIPETLPKEGKWSPTNIKKYIANLHRNFISEYHHYLLLIRIPLAKVVVAAAPSEAGPMAKIWKENSCGCSPSVLAVSFL